MKKPESYGIFIALTLCMTLAPLLTQAVGQLWWGFGAIPLLPFFLLIAFFKLTISQYLTVILWGGWWYDITTGVVGPVGLLSVVIGSLLLYMVAHLIASRSLLSDILTIVLLYIVWLGVSGIVNLVATKINPSSPMLIWSIGSIMVGFVGLILIQLFARRTILRDAVVPKAIL